MGGGFFGVAVRGVTGGCGVAVLLDELLSVEPPRPRLHPVRVPMDYDEKGKKVTRYLGRSLCANCSAKAQRNGSLDFASPGDQKKRLHLADGSKVIGTWWCCNKCKVNLCCEECFEEWNHERNRPPGLCVTV